MTHACRLLPAAATLAILLTSGCAFRSNVAEEALPISARHPITVAPRMEALNLAYDPARAGLDDAGDAALRRFVRDYLENGSGAIAVSASSRYPGASADLVERLAGLGVPRNRILVGEAAEAQPADGIRVTYIRYQAEGPACGDWSVNLGYTAANTTPPNFGCATQHNLAVMVADPRDLVTPKPMDPDDAQRRLTVLERYRRGQSTVTQTTAAQSGAISDVGAGGQ